MASSFTSATSFLPKTLTTRRAPFRKIRSASALTVRSIFTGIVEEMGRVRHVGPTDAGGFELRIGASTVLGGVGLGDSISVNGTCLTVSRFDDSEFTVGLSPETLRRTSLSALAEGSPVNLERALQPTTRMGGHFVQGHVDCTGEIVSVDPEEDSLWVKVRVDAPDDAVHRAERVYYGGRDEPDRGRGL
ncbi:riboflavin synthase-like [Iris pallida]|uniref:Riboflavin synthase-like n=1 Tax=Iris pallida TaxID=29817 RepID=A0AAX6IDL0_IRIPA|nr:riboflavin synthase-like [Iris pallida]